MKKCKTFSDISSWTISHHHHQNNSERSLTQSIESDSTSTSTSTDDYDWDFSSVSSDVSCNGETQCTTDDDVYRYKHNSIYINSSSSSSGIKKRKCNSLSLNSYTLNRCMSGPSSLISLSSDVSNDNDNDKDNVVASILNVELVQPFEQNKIKSRFGWTESNPTIQHELRMISQMSQFTNSTIRLSPCRLLTNDFLPSSSSSLSSSSLTAPTITTVVASVLLDTSSTANECTES